MYIVSRNFYTCNLIIAILRVNISEIFWNISGLFDDISPNFTFNFTSLSETSICFIHHFRSINHCDIAQVFTGLYVSRAQRVIY